MSGSTEEEAVVEAAADVVDEAVVVVYVACPDEAAADAVAGALVDDHLAACVNVIQGVKSHYRWQGKRETSSEVLCLVKCRARDVDAVAARVKQVHPYELPEVVAVPVVGGLPAYLKWVVSETNR